jgi:hypothetical protein
MNTRSSPDAAAAFEKLRSLVGEWRGETPAGAPVGVTYRLSAGDSVLVETWDLGAAREAMTVYHLDGPELMATHSARRATSPG